ncbi:hypothetical protein CLOM_g396 [Closterium sp. NIES-68]|nr:hypothetical protein CLOM_g396 [Closterium sp. NIES-68]
MRADKGRSGWCGLRPPPFSETIARTWETRWPSQPVRSGAQMGGSRLKSQGRISPSPLLSTQCRSPGATRETRVGRAR